MGSGRELKNIDPEKVDRNTIKSNVQFVCIDLTEGEDEQQIFDTINSLGVRLTTAELLKNYFFNRENEQAFKECWEDVFEPTAEKREYWEQEVVTGRIKRTLVDLFFDAFLQILVQDKKRGVTTEDKLFYSRTSNLFQSYKDFIGRYCNGDKDEILDSMKAYAEVFESTFDPGCCDADIPSAPGVERLNVLIFGLKNSTLIPYVLYVRKNAESSSEESEVYALLESYIVRRMLVQATTKNYNRLFTSLILNEVKDAEALRKALEANDEATTYMPGDAEVRTAFEESCLYNLQSKGVLYLLESAIRPGMSSTALLGFNQYTLEHMMPKKWRNKWGALDDEAATRRDRKLLTLGNLAIITHSLNASIRDADWPTKKQGKGYKDGLALCAAGLATMAGALEKESWDEGDIADRAEWLADKALEVWR
ncbi:MAG: HNH endonuclease family protein [Collinsella sp.]|nr:HNH endonuclease family protein [Collinsella sp.]